MDSHFKIAYLKRLTRTNYIIIIFYLTISLAASLSANRLILIKNTSIIPSGFIYMATFVFTDIFAHFNSRNSTIFIALLSNIANLILIQYMNWINAFPYPHDFHEAAAYCIVFHSAIRFYITNFMSTIFSILIDLMIFYYLYQKKNFLFCFASFFSSIIAIIFYTILSDYSNFYKTYPEYFQSLMKTHLYINFISLFIYTMIGQWLIDYLEKKIRSCV